MRTGRRSKFTALFGLTYLADCAAALLGALWRGYVALGTWPLRAGGWWPDSLDRGTLSLVRTWGGILLDYGGASYNVKHPAFGAVGSGVVDDRGAIAAADTVAQAVSTKAAIRIGPGTYRIDSNLTISSACEFAPGARLKPASSSVTITMAGDIRAGGAQLFDLSAGGFVVFSATTGQGRDARPEWFGALRDGSTNDTTAMQGAYSAISAVGGRIVLAPGTYYGTFSVYASAILVSGPGSGLTTIKQPAATYRAVTDAVTTNGSANLTSATGAFTSADVGKTVFVAGAAASTGEDLVAVILSITSGTIVVMDRNAGKAVSGATCRIGCGRNVVEFNRTYLGNNTSAITDCGIEGVTLDGNKSNVSAPASSGDDDVNHAVIFTNCVRWRVRDVRLQNCHNGGLSPVIACDYGDANGVYIESCGNTTVGTAGLEINSSSYCKFRGIRAYLCAYGLRQLDNCFGNEGDIVVRKSTNQAAVFNNQSTNLSTGNRWRVTATECGTGGSTGMISVSEGMFSNAFDFVAEYAGCTFTVGSGVETITPVASLPGVQIGSETLSDARKPQGNRIHITARKNGGEGCIIRANYNDITIIATENWQNSALSGYAVELNGSWNNVAVLCRDSASKQRGIAVRAQGGETGTAATSNRVVILQANPTSPFDDTGTTTSCVDPTYGDGFRQTLDGWYVVDLAANQAATNMTRIPLGTVAVASSWIAPRAGSITAIQVFSNAARTTGTATASVYKNGSAVTGADAVLDGTNTTHKVTTFAKDAKTFAAGDRLEVYITSSGWAPTTADLRGAIEVET